MTYQPAIKVEIAFDSGYTTPAASRTWTDVTAYWEAADGYEIQRGRSDEFGEVTPSTLSLTLDNRDGRFTADRSASPYYPNVKIGRPIRVTATPVGGAASIRGVFYIDEWPVVWDGTDAYAAATITATSRTARLGLNAALLSLVEEEMRLLEPIAYYTLGEASGATQANDSSGNSAPPLTRWDVGGTASLAPQFGQDEGPPADGLTGVETNTGGDPLSVELDVPTASDFTIVWAMTTTDASEVGVLGWGDLLVVLGDVVTPGRIGLTAPSLGGSIDFGEDVNDGSVNFFALTWDDSANLATLDTNGVTGSSETLTTAIPGPRLVVGNHAHSLIAADFSTLGASPQRTADATFYHLAVFDRVVTASELIWVQIAARFGFNALPAGTTLGRLADYAGIPTAERSFATGDADIAALETSGKSVVEVMHQVAATDGGLLFDARDGTLTYQARSVRINPSPVLTLQADLQEIEADYKPKLDRLVLANDVTATNVSGTLTCRVVDAASRDDYGTYSDSIELATDDPDTLRDAAAWQVNTRREPKLRTPSLSVNLLNLSTARQDALLSADMSSLVTVTGLPSQAATSGASYFVEGYTETVTDVTYAFTINVTDGAPWLSTMLLDSRAVLDTNTVAY